MTTPEEGLRVINGRFGVHPRHRALHAKGVHCTATFTGSEEGARLSRAAHLSGERVPVSVRFSNGGGDPTVPDYDPDVRGLAVSFHLPDGSRTDILSQTLDRFPFKDQEGFFDSVRASKPSLSGLAHMPGLLARTPKAILALPGTMRGMASLPTSFAARSYKALHAFGMTNGEGETTWVRYTWRPTIPEANISRRDAKAAGRDYLFDELSERLSRGPVRMEMDLQIAAADDDPHDPSSVWPKDRERVIAGTLEVTAIDDEADDGIVFDPMRLTEGLEASNDPALRFRPPVYDLSHARRTA
ncbi:MAG: catalase family peroxidase [Solirubrobacterales bacterium]